MSKPTISARATHASNRARSPRPLGALAIAVCGLAAVQACSAAGEEGHGFEDEHSFDELSPAAEVQGSSLEGFAGSLDGDVLEAELDPLDEQPELGTLQQALVGSCGSQSNRLNQFLDLTLVPDTFPADSPVAAAAMIAMGMGETVHCIPFGFARMFDACDDHDACYGTLGRSKAECDRIGRARFKDVCRGQYDEATDGEKLRAVLFGDPFAISAVQEGACRDSCLGFATAMGDIMTTSPQSRDAYDAAQRDAARGGGQGGSSSGPSAPRPSPACVASCEQNCLSLPFDQIGQCQTGCPNAC